MRLINPATGTVVGVGDETGKRYLAAGWKSADEPAAKPKPRRARAKSEPDESDAKSPGGAGE